MAAALLWSPVRPHDSSCAFCGDGKVAVRFRGKACCSKCADAIDEAWPTLPKAPAVPPDRERALVRYLLGLGHKEYFAPLHERALRARGTYR